MRRDKGLRYYTYVIMITVLIAAINVGIYAASDEDDWSGYWTYDKTIIVEYANELSNYYGSNPSDNTVISYSVSANKIDYRFNYTGSGYQEDLYGEYLKDPGKYQYETIILSGEHGYVEYNFGKVNKQYRENAPIAIDVNLKMYDYKIFHFDELLFDVIAWTNIYNPGAITFKANKDISNKSRFSNRLNPLFFESKALSGKMNDNGQFTGFTPYGVNNGDIMTIELEIMFQQNASLSFYSGQTEKEFDYSKIKIYHVYTWKYGTKGIIIGGAAADFPGEDRGVNVPAIIITGVLGIGATLAAAGIMNNREKPKSKYKMYIRKDFGNAIRYDKPPVTVYSRMAEITADGNEIDRPDLTEQITISSGGVPIEIGDVQFTGYYMGALVSASSAPGADNPQEGIISFLFTGEGGTFRNNVTFKLVGSPYIKHEKISKYSGSCIIEMIFGDGLTYESIFTPTDFVDIPQVTIQGTDEVKAKLEKLEDGSYKAILENGSQKSDERKTITVRIIAENEKEKAESDITIILYPEGIFVSADYDEEKRLIVRTEETEELDNLDLKIKSTRMDVTLAIIDKSEDRPKTIIADMKEVETVFHPLEGHNQEMINLTKAFKYEINPDFQDEGIFYFAPKVTLPERENQAPYIVGMKVSCDYKGVSYDKDLTVRLVGEKPERRGDWKTEYKLLKRTVQRFGLSGNGEARNLIRAADKHTAYELNMIRRAIIIEATNYYTKETDEFNDIENKLAKMEFIFSVIKWFGDQAFSYLVTVYGGGPAVDAFISPLKDYYGEFIGEVGAQLFWGEKISFSEVNLFLALEAGIENTLVNMMTGLEVPTPKKVGTLIASYVMLNFSKHYLYTEDSKGDIYKTLINMGGDLTVNGIKALVANYFDKFLKAKPDFANKVSAWVHKYIKKSLPEVKGFEIIRKYLEETIGLATGTIYEGVAPQAGHLGYLMLTFTVDNVKIAIDLGKNILAITEMVFNQFLSILSYPSQEPKKPDVPQYYQS